MKTAITLLLMCILTIGLVACDITGDKSGDGRETWSSWETLDGTNKYIPTGHGIPKISYSDRQEIQLLMGLGDQVVVVEELGRFVQTTSTWELTEFTLAPHWWPWKIKINGIWVSYTSPITLELHSTHKPIRKEPQKWQPADPNDPKNPIDPDDTSTWGEWDD